MSTPQNPGGDTPQDPQNPYGNPPPPPHIPPPTPPPSTPPPSTPPPSTPPPSTPPPAAPVDPAPAPPYGEPTSPAEPAAPPPPAYGQPAAQPAYGQPPAQPAYGQPAYPQYAPQGSGEPGKGMAVAALIISFFGCTCLGALVAIPMAIVVLVRGKDGRNHGKGLAITALIISVLSLVAGIAIAVALGSYVSQFKSVNDLNAGQCITAKGLTDEDAESVTEIKSVSCSTKHDAEVLATVELTADQAKGYSDSDPEEVCGPAIEAAGKTAVLAEDISVTALTEPDPGKGDTVACVAYHVDGSKLTSKLGS